MPITQQCHLMNEFMAAIILNHSCIRVHKKRL